MAARRRERGRYCRVGFQPSTRAPLRQAHKPEGGALLKIVEFKGRGHLMSRCGNPLQFGRRGSWPDRTTSRSCAALGRDNAAGEVLPYRIVANGRDAGLSASVVTCDETETLGVNTRADSCPPPKRLPARARAQQL